MKNKEIFGALAISFLLFYKYYYKNKLAIYERKEELERELNLRR